MGIYVDSVASHSNDIEIYSNIIKDCHSGLQLACEYGGDIYDIRIHDNDFIHCHQEGIALSNYYTSNPMDNIKIYNNRMWNLYQGHSNASGIYLANNEATNVEIKNNVINGTVDVCPIRKGTAYLPNNYNISGNTFHQIVANQPTGSPYYILDDGLTYTLNLPYYNSSYEILTNKRINPRVNEYATNSATITPNTDTDDEVSVYGAQQNLTIAAPTGTPVKGQKLILRFVDNSAPRTLTWNAIYKPIGAILPTTTVSSKHLYVGFIYDVIANKWDCVAVAQEV
jgi:polygalacturonase